MHLRELRRGMGRGMRGVGYGRRWMITAGVVLGMLAALQFLLALAVGITAAQHAIAQQPLRLEMRSGTSDGAAQRAYVTLRSIPQVADVRFVTREQTEEREYRRRQAGSRNPESLLPVSPYRDALLVTLEEPGAAPLLFDAVGSDRYAPWFDPGSVALAHDRADEISAALRILSALRTGVLAVAAVAMAGLLLLLLDIARRRAELRKDALRVEALAGAGRFAIVLPFAVETGILLLIAFSFSALLLVLLALLLASLVADASLAGVFRDVFSAALPPLLVVEFISLPFLSAIGAWLGVRGVMKK